MMAKKDSKKNAKNDSSDLSALDSAVSELARQTEALLGKSGEKLKPTLPKKKPTSHASARSFDIIHAGDSAKKPAVLKSAPPEQKMLEQSDEKLLQENSDTEPATSSDVVPEIVTSHKSGSLKVSVAEPTESQTNDQTEADAPEKAPKKAKKSTTKTSKKSEEESSSPDDSDATKPEELAEVALLDDAKKSNEDTERDKQDTSTEDTPSSTDEVTSTDSAQRDNGSAVETDDGPASAMATDPKIAPVHQPSDSTQNIQLYSDNLTKDQSTEEDGEDESKTDLFDTDEYHPTLHDWSKLEHKSKGPVIALLVLTVMFALGVYAVMNGYTLPF